MKREEAKRTAVVGLENAVRKLDQREKDNIKFHLKKRTRILCGRNSSKYVGRGGAG